MFLVTLPSNQLLVTPEQLPRFLANISETRYTTITGEVLQTTSQHEFLKDAVPITVLTKRPSDEELAMERDRGNKLAERLAKSKGKSRR